MDDEEENPSSYVLYAIVRVYPSPTQEGTMTRELPPLLLCTLHVFLFWGREGKEFRKLSVYLGNCIMFEAISLKKKPGQLLMSES